MYEKKSDFFTVSAFLAIHRQHYCQYVPLNRRQRKLTLGQTNNQLLQRSSLTKDFSSYHHSHGGKTHVLFAQKINSPSFTTSNAQKSRDVFPKKYRNKRRFNYSTSNQKKQYKGQMTKRNKICSMFRQAKDLERTGQWRQASDILSSILEMDPYDAHSYLALARLESRREKIVPISTNTPSENVSNEPQGVQKGEGCSSITSISAITPLSISQTELFSKARQTFYNGTTACPDSVHLWQAWALHEQLLGNVIYARYLFQKALLIDKFNPYVCHAFGLLEQRCGNLDAAIKLWEQPLNYTDSAEVVHKNNTNTNRADIKKRKGKRMNKTTAALVCSLGKLFVSLGRFECARTLYSEKVFKIESEREKSEVYLAAAWLEEKHFKDKERAEELLTEALAISPGNSRAQVALAKLEGRRLEDILSSSDRSTKFYHSKKTATSSKNHRNVDTKDRLQSKNDVIRKRLMDSCMQLILEKKEEKKYASITSRNYRHGISSADNVKDGRMFNAWADLERKAGNFESAKRILRDGMVVFPHDHSLLHAIGKIEERCDNPKEARKWYSASLAIQPNAPTLISYALLELRHSKRNACDYSKVAKLFDEALLLDPRHGPIYNAYGNMERKRGNIDKARRIYQNGIHAHCKDLASVYHGLAKLELSLGNVDIARSVLTKGLEVVDFDMMDSSKHKRAIFLTHTLGMLEMNSNRINEAKIVFEDGIKRHGNSSQLLLGAALCEERLGCEQNAREMFERSVDADRKHAQSWQSWGVMEMRSGNYKVAKTLFECGIQINSNHGALWQAYATMESRRGNTDAARALFAAGVMKCPNHVPLYQAWACLELRCENYEKAKVVIGEALTRDKTQDSGWLVAAKIEEKLGNSGLVGLILKRGLSHCQFSVELYCALAEYEIKQGKIELARELLEKGLDLDPCHAPLYHSLAELEARVFNIEGLADLNRRASAIFNNNAVESSPLSMKTLRDKLRGSKVLPPNISQLLRIVSPELDLDEVVTEMDPDMIIKKMSQYNDSDDIFGEDIKLIN